MKRKGFCIFHPRFNTQYPQQGQRCAVQYWVESDWDSIGRLDNARPRCRMRSDSISREIRDVRHVMSYSFKILPHNYLLEI